jgi:hypothetical protein
MHGKDRWSAQAAVKPAANPGFEARVDQEPIFSFIYRIVIVVGGVNSDFCASSEMLYI